MTLFPVRIFRMLSFSKCVDLGESSSQWNQDIDDFVRYLNSPKLGIINTLNSEQELCVMRLPSSELVTEMKGKSSSVLCEMDKKDCKQTSMKKIVSEKAMKSGNMNSSDIDEAVELSFDSATSSSGFKDTRVTFTCDTSPETSDLDLSTERVSTDAKCSPKKKEKESKKRRFRKMITRPLRRSKSAGCANDIPAHALFVGSDKDKKQDTMEDRAVELAILDERLRVDNIEGTDRDAKKVHKTCSADAATMASTGLMHMTKANISLHTKSKAKKSGFQNVKRKFQFLRRRNTDTTLVPKLSLSPNFTIPTHSQALQWNKSIESLLNDKSGLELFMGFLKSEFSEENLEFWIACEELRVVSESKIPAMVLSIYTEFVGFNAPKEVNLDSITRMNTKESLENPSRDTFQVAQRKIQALMEKDSYSRFIESELYQHLLVTLSKS